MQIGRINRGKKTEIGDRIYECHDQQSNEPAKSDHCAACIGTVSFQSMVLE
jgi:hypothetical protein